MSLSASNRRTLPWLMSFALWSFTGMGLLAVALLAWFGCDYYEDDMYNRGVIHLSAHFGGGQLITSLVAVYFQKYAIIRHEDWHRGLSLLLAAWLEAHIGYADIFKVLHIIYLAAISGMAIASIVKLLSGVRRGALITNAHLAFIAVVAFFATKYGSMLVMRAAVDDVPATVFSMAGFLLLIWSFDPSPRELSLAGLCFSVAFWMKDFHVLYVGVACVALLWHGTAVRRADFWPVVRQVLWLCVWFTPGFLLKLLWNYHSIGHFIAPVSSYHNIVYSFGGTRGIDPHDLFFLHGAGPSDGVLAISGGWGEALHSLFRKDIAGLGQAVRNLAPFLPLFISGLVLLRRVDRKSFAYRMMAVAFLALSLVSGALLLGLGEIQQVRYQAWPVIFLYATSLTLVISSASRWHLALVGGGCSLLLAYNICQTTHGLVVKSAPVPDTCLSVVAANIRNEQSAPLLIAGTREALYSYSRQQGSILALNNESVKHISPNDLQRLVAVYGVRRGVLINESKDITFRFLDSGFVQDGGTSDCVLIRRLGTR